MTINYNSNILHLGAKCGGVHIILRRVILLLFFLGLVNKSMAEDYVFYSNNHYMAVVNGNLTGVEGFNPETCIWTGSSSGTFTNSGKTLKYSQTWNDGDNGYVYINTTSLNFTGTDASITLSNGNQLLFTAYTYRYRKRNRDNWTNYNGSWYIYYDDGWKASTENTNYTYYYVVHSEYGGEDTTNSPEISYSGLNSGHDGLQFSHNDLSGTYTADYIKYNFNSTDHYWYDNSDHNSEPTTISSWDPTYSWSIQSGNNVSISSNGVLTFTGVPSGPIVVKLTTSGISPLPNKEDPYTLTVGTTTALDETVTGDMTISPSSVTLDMGESVTFTASSSISQSHRTRPEYVTVSDESSNPLLYYVNNAVSETEPQIMVDNTPLAFHHFQWSSSEGGTSYYDISDYYSDSQNTTTVTRSENMSNAERTFTINLRGYYGPSRIERSAQATVVIPITYIDLAGISCTGLTLTYGGNGILVPNTWIENNGAKYVNLIYTSNNESVATVSADGTVTATGAGQTTITIQSIKRNGDPGPDCEAYITVNKADLLAPTIVIDKSGQVTIIDNNAPEAGATIYYTTDESNPINSATRSNYSGVFSVTNLKTVKAVAIGDSNHNNSPVEAQMYITSGISGTSVIINDLEDHNWTYYQPLETPDDGYPDALHSPDPRNVKITYKGGSVNNASAVAVSTTENVNTFVYYKTIEKTAWGDSEGKWLTGDYAYMVIPNPFSKRPRANKTTTDTDGFYGFGGWKITKGHKYVRRANGNMATENAILNLEEKINFVGLDYDPSNPNAVTAEVEFTAEWVAATVIKANGDISGDQGLDANGTYETNFVVFTNSGNKTVRLTRAATVSNQYPDGSSIPGSSTVLNFSTSTVPVKLEYVKIGDGVKPTHPTDPTISYTPTQGSGEFQARGEGELIVGRGCEGTVLVLNSGNNGGKYNFRIESGKYTFMNPMHHGRPTNNSANSANYGRVVLGCDFDRASSDGIDGNGTGDNTKLRVVNYITVSYRGASGSGNSEWMDITVKSGYYGYSANYSLYQNTGAGNGNVDGYGLGIGGNTDGYDDTYTTIGPNNNQNISYSYPDRDNTMTSSPTAWMQTLSFYAGPTRGSGKEGVNRMLIEGGEFNSINGGGNTAGNQNTTCFYFRMKGGWVKGAVYGTASISNSAGSRKLVFTGGEVNGWVAGGCNGTDFGNGQGYNEGTCYIYAGGATEFRSHDGNGTYNNAYGLVFNVPGGQIFGAGRGLAPDNGHHSANQHYCGSTTTSYVTVADEAFVEQNVYGGGYNGVAQNSHVYITGGTIGNKVFGGTARAVSTDQTWRSIGTDIKMYGGTVKGGIYGGHDETGVQFGDANVAIYGGTVGDQAALTDATKTAFVHGGGFGDLTVTQGDVNVTVGNSQSGPTIYGDVYGGSALGQINATANFNIPNYNTSPITVTVTNPTYNNGKKTDVTLNAGTIYGSLYGGALGQKNGVNGANRDIAANVYGPVTVTVNGGTVNTTAASGSGAVFGCNNINGAPQRAVAVIINGTDPAPGNNSYAIDAVYGGGNKANYNYGTPTVTVNNCDNSIGYVYGGGNAAHITNGNTDVTIYGGNKIGSVFGGGNGTDNQADVSGNTNVKIYGGTILDVYGGSNSKGSIGGSINVTVDNSQGTGCTMLIDNLYGGGNLAPSNAGNLNIVCTGTDGYIGNVYGGANQANITGDINLVINGGNIGNAFGGNNQSGTISGNITVSVGQTPNNCGVFEIGNVYGGGNLAAYGGAESYMGNYPEVNIYSGTITNNVFGGGLGSTAIVYGSPRVTVSGGSINNVFGGGEEAAVFGSVTVNINGGTINNDVYGGGALANTNIGNATNYGQAGEMVSQTSTYTTAVNLHGGTIVGKVFGGGLGQKADPDNSISAVPAYVYGNVTVKLNEENSDNCVVQGKIFGCNNYNGSPKGTVLVHVYRTEGWTGHNVSAGKGDDTVEKGTDVYELEAVYGGGNEAAYKPVADNSKAKVIIDGCDLTSIKFVYGGGNAAPVPASELTVNGCYEIYSVYGGGNGYDALDDGTPNPGADVGLEPYTTGTAYALDGTKQAYGLGTTTVNINGGTVHNVFGGSNTLGNIRERTIVNLEESDDGCPLEIDEVYGGGKAAPQDASSQINLGCVTYLKEIYGGSYQANINNSVVLTVTSGRFDRVFGGNNLGGTINGTITVNVEETGCTPIVIGQLYGGGNQASYTAPEGEHGPTVNAKSFTSIGEVYGGGLGTNAIVTGDTYVNINEAILSNQNSKKGFAGAEVTLGTGADAVKVDIPARPADSEGAMGVIGSVFGGGNAAKVIGNTNVNIGTAATVSFESLNDDPNTTEDESVKTVSGANIARNIFGGGNKAEVTGNANVKIGQ